MTFEDMIKRKSELMAKGAKATEADEAELELLLTNINKQRKAETLKTRLEIVVKAMKEQNINIDELESFLNPRVLAFHHPEKQWMYYEKQVGKVGFIEKLKAEPKSEMLKYALTEAGKKWVEKQYTTA